MRSGKHISMCSMCVCLLLSTVACGLSDGSNEVGALSVLLESEETIVDGIKSGTEAEDVRDGWAVSFDKYQVAIGDVDLTFSTDQSKESHVEDVFVVDLVKVPSAGLALWSFSDLSAGRWDFNYSTLGAGDGSTRHESVSEADYKTMVDNDWTYFVSASISKADGQSCPPKSLAMPGDKMPNGNKSGDNDCYDAPEVKFAIGASAETKFGPCEIDDVPGVAVAANTSKTVAATIHGDHLFFNGFPEGDEGGVTRLAQWWADCDLNLDGTVTKEELEAISPSLLPEIDMRYQLGGSPITPLNDMYDYVIAQLKTQGHYQGEGECPADGKAHEHGGHDDHD
jgi:hypothetical protein